MKSHTTKAGTVLPMLNLRGKDYLEVKYRIVWFREERPDWSIETEFTHMADKSACAKATVRDTSGRIVATSHKIEAASHFPDFAEKAETGAIGRALALLGYGTQFCGEEMDEGKRIVDSPVGHEKVAPKDRPASDPHGPAPEGTEHLVDDSKYVISFGTHKHRTLEEIGPDAARAYVIHLEHKAKKEGKEIDPDGVVADFIKRAEKFVADAENAPLQDPKEMVERARARVMKGESK